MRSVFCRLFFVLFAFVLPARSDGLVTGDIETNSWARPYHFGKAPKGKVFAQTENGFGLRYYYKVLPGEVELYADINRFSGDVLGPSTTFRLGAQNEYCRVGNVGIVIGIAGEVLQYYNKYESKTHLPGSLYPTLGFRYRRATLALGYTAPSSSGKQHYPGMLSSHLSIRF